MYKRLLLLEKTIIDRSIFLLGPRQTGKSTLLRLLFPSALFIDLLRPQTFTSLTQNLSVLEELILARPDQVSEIVVIDEIQKLPEVLDEVQRLMFHRPNLRFVLTGSSARKLRRHGTNLLGGRARMRRLVPLTTREYATGGEIRAEDVLRLLQVGGIPSILDGNDPWDDLQGYVGVYLQEEIAAEGATRSIPAFSRFLKVAATCNGEQVNFAGVASDAEVPAKTVRDYFQILSDTLIGTLVEPFRGGLKRKTVSAPKFYYFDVGVANFLLGRRTLESGTPEFGRSLEHLVWCELTAHIAYRARNHEIFYWRSAGAVQREVDFVITNAQSVPLVAIEVKGSGRISKKDLHGIEDFSSEWPKVTKIVVCSESAARTTTEGIQILPYTTFFARLWRGEVISEDA